MKPGSSASASSRSRGTRPSRRTGSWTVASQPSGSTHRNRSRVCESHDHRRFMASSSSAASSGGRDGRTVKLRRAFIRADPSEGRRPTDTALPGCNRAFIWAAGPCRHPSGTVGGLSDEGVDGGATGACGGGDGGQAAGVGRDDRGARPRPRRGARAGAGLRRLPHRPPLPGGRHQRRVPVPPRPRGGRAWSRPSAPTSPRSRPGDFVILNWRAVCGECRSCRRGRPQYCFATHNATQKMTLDGVALSPALGIGAFAEKTLVAAGQCTKVSAAVKPEVAGSARLRRHGRHRCRHAHRRGRAGRLGRRVRLRGRGRRRHRRCTPGRRGHDHRRRPRPAEARAGQGVRRHPHGRRVGGRPGRGDPGADRRQRRRRLHRGRGQPEGVRAGVLRPRPRRHGGPGRRAEPRDAHRAADDRLLRSGRPAQAELVRRLPARAATSRC